MKKIILSFMILTIVLNLSACGNKNSTSKDNGNENGVVEVVTEFDTEYVKIRNGLNNTYHKLKNDKKLTVAYLGGSITAGAGATNHNATSWRALTTKWLSENFPDSQITEINMGIGSVGSLLPVFYLDDYVINEIPDLVFIETAVNDYLQHYTAEEISVYYESIIRKLLNANPYCEIVAIYTINDVLSVSAEYYTEALSQDSVAAYYGIPSANVGRKLRKDRGLINPKSGGEYTQRWQTFFGDEVHPTDAGHKEYANTITYLLDSAFSIAKTNDNKAQKITLPKQINENLLIETKFIPTTDFDLTDSKNWKHNNNTAQKGKWGVSNTVYTDTADNELVFEFEGQALYAVSSVIPFDGTAELYKVSVDGGEWITVLPSGGNPKLLVKGLQNKKHTVKFVAGGVGENAKSDAYKEFSVEAFLAY